MKRFRCLELALNATKIGESMPAVLNAANEIAVDAFLKGQIAFLQIPQLIEEVMAAHHLFPIHTIEDVLEVDHWTREAAIEMVQSWRS
jgi:1-deoxy-D-xylulose-5-phosphate reductoisomerase